MDEVQDWAKYLVGNYAVITPYAGRFLNAISTAKAWLLPLIDQVSKKPDLATIALLLVIVLVSLKILDMLWQTVTFWFRLARRLLFWGGLIAVAVWMYSRGPDGVAEDVQQWYRTWDREYQHWKKQEQMARSGMEYKASKGQRFVWR